MASHRFPVGLAGADDDQLASAAFALACQQGDQTPDVRLLKSRQAILIGRWPRVDRLPLAARHLTQDATWSPPLTVQAPFRSRVSRNQLVAIVVEDVPKVLRPAGSALVTAIPWASTGQRVPDGVPQVVRGPVTFLLQRPSRTAEESERLAIGLVPFTSGVDVKRSSLTLQDDIPALGAVARRAAIMRFAEYLGFPSRTVYPKPTPFASLPRTEREGARRVLEQYAALAGEVLGGEIGTEQALLEVLLEAGEITLADVLVAEPQTGVRIAPSVRRLLSHHIETAVAHA
jgi:hypothetical protein